VTAEIKAEATPPSVTDGEPNHIDWETNEGKGGKNAVLTELAQARARIKELEPLAVKAQQLEEQSKTELERLSERATAAETKAAEAELQMMKLEIAAAKGLEPARIKYMSGTTKEELESSAIEIAEWSGPRTPERPPGRPVERLQSGSVPVDDQKPADVDSWIRSAVAARSVNR
jgi:DNA-directed RNA polymerase specialized sigma54-like protein